jgi:hypothetical protein
MRCITVLLCAFVVPFASGKLTTCALRSELTSAHTAAFVRVAHNSNARGAFSLYKAITKPTLDVEKLLTTIESQRLLTKVSL